jgi:hypothetical protein
MFLKKILLLLLAVISFHAAFGQYTQTVRGRVFDNETKSPLVGVKIQVFTADSVKNLRALSDADGLFEIPGVPIGKHELNARFITYDTKNVTIIVQTLKETVL